MGKHETRDLLVDGDVRAIATALMRHLGWTDEVIAEAETHRCEDTCEDIGFGWDCVDEDGDSRHLEADNLAESCAMANLAIETLTGRGWQPPASERAEMDLVATVAELAELSRELRFWHSKELAHRLDSIIAHRFGYVARPIGEEQASA